MLPLTIPALLSIMPKAGDAVVAWIGPLEQAMVAFDIYSPARAAMFLANVAHESRELTALEEDFHYRSADRLLAVFGHHFADLAEAQRYLQLGPVALASHVYGNRMGNGNEASTDGWTYRGRGPNQLTGRDNYRAASIAICGDADTLLNNPEFLKLPDFGAAASCWHWNAASCSTFADAGDFDGVCDKINIGRKTKALGDAEGFKSREHYLQAALAAMQ